MSVILFTNSCAPIQYPCAVGAKVIDPCTCTGYLECATAGYNFLVRDCGRGTAWNHNTGFCVAAQEIFIANGTPVCPRNIPWSRCSSVPNHYGPTRLKRFCTGGGSDPPLQDTGSDGDDNTGAIVGGVIGAVVVLLLAAIVVLLVRKLKGMPKGSITSFLPSQGKRSNPHDDEEVYDVIDDKHMQPGYVGNPSYERNKAEYDNPAFSKEDSHNEYTNFRSPDNLSPGISPRKQLAVLSDSSRDDLSRSISINGQDVLVQDSEGYHVGYPSGSVPRQPSPVPPNDGDISDKYDMRDDYDLGTGHKDYLELEKTEL